MNYNITHNRAEWYCFDTETVTSKTKYYKEHQDTRGILWIGQKFGCPDSPFLKFIDYEPLFEFLFNGTSKTVFFHNLTFDGDFLIKYMVNHMGFTTETITERMMTIEELESQESNKGNNSKKSKKNKTLDIFMSGSKIYYIKAWYTDANHNLKFVIFRCSLHMLNSSIEDLGKSLGINKYEGITASEKKTFYDLEPVNDINEFPDKFVEYCSRDVKIMNLSLMNLEQSLLSIPQIQEWEKSHKKKFSIFQSLTIGSLGLRLMKQIFLPRFNTNPANKLKYKNRVKLFMRSQDEHRYMRQFFYGGWTQFNPEFQGSYKEVHGMFIDVNSAYPYQMTKWLPYGNLLDKKPTLPHVTLKQIYVSHAKIKPEFYNVVTLKDWTKTTGERYVRELSDFTCYYFEEEWETLSKMYDFEGCIINDLYMLTKPFLKEYIDTLYYWKAKYKAEGKKALAQGIKILLNACYGKLASREQFNAIYFDEHGKLERGQEVEFTKIQKNGKSKVKTFKVRHESRENPFGQYHAISLEPQDEPSKYGLVGTAAYITSLERVYLWETIIKIGADRFIYSDTDSIAIDITNRSLEQIEKIIPIDSEVLGFWDAEKTFKTISIGGAKKYICVDYDENGKEVAVKVALSGMDEHLFYKASESLDKAEIDLEKLKSNIDFSKDKYMLNEICLRRTYCKSGIILDLIDKQFSKGTL